MIGTLRNRWLLLRLAAGISRADTPRGWVLNALRAVNFVVLAVAFSAPVMFIGLIPMVAISGFRLYPAQFLYVVHAAVFAVIGVLLSFVILPKLISVKSRARKNSTELSGLLLAFVTSCYVMGVLWLAQLGFILGILVCLPVLVSVGFVFWNIRQNYDSSEKKTFFVLNVVFFFVGVMGWYIAWGMLLWIAHGFGLSLIPCNDAVLC